MTKHPAQHVLSALTSQPWAITQDGLRLMIAIADRSQSDIAAVEAQLGRKLANTQTVTERDGVAVLPIEGPLARHANLFSAISGATSIELLARDFNAALNNGAVRAIVLNIDSPGGEVNGTDEFAGMVYAARGQKPIYAYIGGTGCSAAYWIASAADQVVCSPTAMLGSIGVIATVQGPDESGDIEIVSSQSPRKNPDPTTEEGRSDVQATIDALAGVFVETVARNRGVSPSTVLSTFGAGGVFVGGDAVTAGLADKLGSYEDVIAELSGRGPAKAKAITASALNSLSTGTLRTTTDALAAQGEALIKLATLPLGYSAPTASGGARVHIPQPTKEQPNMSEDTAQAPPVDDEHLIGASVAQAFAGISDQLTAKQTELLQAQWQAMKERSDRQAEEMFARWTADQETRQRITAWAQDATTAKIDRRHALSCTANDLVALALETPAPIRAKWQALIDRTLDNGFVSFEEIGSAGDGKPEQSKTEEFEALVAEKKATGMAQSAALRAAAKARPDLYAAYSGRAS